MTGICSGMRVYAGVYGAGGLSIYWSLFYKISQPVDRTYKLTNCQILSANNDTLNRVTRQDVEYVKLT